MPGKRRTIAGRSAMITGAASGIGALTEPRFGKFRMARRGGYGIERLRRRNVGRKPRRGQNRDASRFAPRQSTLIEE